MIKAYVSTRIIIELLSLGSRQWYLVNNTLKDVLKEKHNIEIWIKNDKWGDPIIECDATDVDKIIEVCSELLEEEVVRS